MWVGELCSIISLVAIRFALMRFFTCAFCALAVARAALDPSHRPGPAALLLVVSLLADEVRSGWATATLLALLNFARGEQAGIQQLAGGRARVVTKCYLSA